MLDNTLTLSVDAANDGNPADESYTRYSEFENRSQYIGSAHALDMRDTIGFYRSFPSRSGNFKGVGKSSFKITMDVVVPGVDGSDITSPIILEVSASVPVGALPADIEHVRQKCVSLIDDSTLMSSLQTQLQV